MPNELPLLFSYRRCPYAMRARMALLQAGVRFETREISLRDKPPEMLRLSPKGTVPVLLLPGGRVIDESLDVMQWAFDGRDAEGWWVRGQTASCQSLLATTDGEFKRLLDRYKYPERFDAGPNEREAFRREAVQCLIDPLEVALSSARYLGGELPAAVDLAIFPFVRQFRGVDATWFDAQSFNAVQRWLQGWIGSALFERCMAKTAG